MFFPKLAEAIMEVLTIFSGFPKQSFAFNGFYRCQCCSTSQWSSSEGGSMVSWLKYTAHFGTGQHGTHGESSGDGLGQGGDVRSHLEGLAGEHLPGTSEAGLHFVKY